MFTPSVTPWATAVEQIADCAGASGDHQMRQRAHNSLAAAVKYFNRRFIWRFLDTEHTPISLVAPFGMTITAGISASASASADMGLVVGDFLVGNGFQPGLRVTATGASGFGLNAVPSGITADTTVSATANRDLYDPPSDYRTIYSVRLPGRYKPLVPFPRRAYDRTIDDEFRTGEPDYYDLYPLFDRSKFRILPPPDGNYTLLMRYYRRMYVATASSDGTVLDIPEDFDPYLIAWAKWHFLTDKNRGSSDQATTWITLAREGIRTMVADGTVQPDEELALSGRTPTPNWSRQSTRWLDWDYT